MSESKDQSQPAVDSSIFMLVSPETPGDPEAWAKIIPCSGGCPRKLHVPRGMQIKPNSFTCPSCGRGEVKTDQSRRNEDVEFEPELSKTSAQQSVMDACNAELAKATEESRLRVNAVLDKLNMKFPPTEDEPELKLNAVQALNLRLFNLPHMSTRIEHLEYKVDSARARLGRLEDLGQRVDMLQHEVAVLIESIEDLNERACSLADTNERLDGETKKQREWLREVQLRVVALERLLQTPVDSEKDRAPDNRLSQSESYQQITHLQLSQQAVADNIAELQRVESNLLKQFSDLSSRLSALEGWKTDTQMIFDEIGPRAQALLAMLTNARRG